MSKHTEAIRAALAKNPTLGAWIAELGEAYVVRSQADGGRVAICTNLRGFHGMGGRRDGDEVAANAHLIAACNPVNVAALLAERDALLNALEYAAPILNGLFSGELPACFKPSVEVVNEVNRALHQSKD